MSVLAIAPLLFIPSLRRLSTLSGLGFVSTLLVTLVVCAVVVVDPHRADIPHQVPSPPPPPLLLYMTCMFYEQLWPLDLLNSHLLTLCTHFIATEAASSMSIHVLVFR